MKKYEYKYHYVFIITNKITGRLYLGVHSTNNLEDEYFGYGKLLSNALKKYGKENFSIHKQFHENRKKAYKKLDEIKRKTKVRNGLYKKHK